MPGLHDLSILHRATSVDAHANALIPYTNALYVSKYQQLAYARERLHRLPRLTLPPNIHAPRACLCHRLSVHRRTVAPISPRPRLPSYYTCVTNISWGCHEMQTFLRD